MKHNFKKHLRLHWPFAKRATKQTLVVLALGCSLLAKSQDTNLKITSPYSNPNRGVTVSGTVTLAVKAENASAINEMAFYVDGNLIKTVKAHPFSCLWVPKPSDAGLHELVVVAQLRNGNKESTVQMFTVAAPNAITNQQKLSPALPATKGKDGFFYKVETPVNSTSEKHNEGLTIWKSPDQKNWQYLGLVWSFEGDGNEAEQKWTVANGNPSRMVQNAAINFVNNNYYIHGSFENNISSKLLKSTTGLPQGPYIITTELETKAFQNARLANNSNSSVKTNIWPNPSLHSFRINTTGRFSYTIVNSAMQTVEIGSGSTNTVVGEKLKSGMYLLTIIHEDGTLGISKLIKE